MKRRAAALLLAGLLGAAAGVQADETRAGSRQAGQDLRETTRGMASWYGAAFHGKPTASGEPFDMHAFTAAHPTLPFGTMVEVRSLRNGRTVRVRVNDRGPYKGRRIIDLSRAAAEALGLKGRGTQMVQVTVVERGADASVSEAGADLSR